MYRLLITSATLPWAIGSLFVLDQTYTPAISCSDLRAPDIDGASVVSFTAEELTGDGIDVCNVNVYLTHEDAADRVRVQTYLPLSGYTGRLQGVGGGGMVAGVTGEGLITPAGQGFVAVTTDAGRPNATEADDTWAGNDQLLRNFAYLSVHEMTVASKALAEQFYDRPVEYAYWVGCSNGGRQGYEEAQRYPKDYDGILANAPGINWDRFLVVDVFPYLVQVAEDDFPPTCVWEGITAAAVEACDELDGARDGVIGDPFRCQFDAQTTIGQHACNTTVTETHARMWNDITRGPYDTDGNRIWDGLTPGSNFTSLAADNPFAVSRAWIAAFVEKNLGFDVATIGLHGLASEVSKSEAMYREVIGGDSPDLSGLRDAGGKLLTWHGLIDQLLPAYGTISYRLRVEELLGGNGAVNDFYRLFLAPGVDHCGALGIGAQPSEALQALMEWVENGTAPETMSARGPVGSRDLCLYPKDLVYSGQGEVADASSWTCS